MAYWSPDKQFYLAMVIELETKKMARQDNPIKAAKRQLSLDYLEEAVNVEAKKIASKKKCLQWPVPRLWKETLSWVAQLKMNWTMTWYGIEPVVQAFSIWLQSFHH
ncbi:uncharacterized protein LOC134182763 [Corticium candelabrum]|uniref:uncharacterized protein LOC134182763 n=1 Tax=Corticium candelabrum TaxID=121492 RepID=UPI002E2761DD|nr:uncharacterized protein LOC134182763 [Corticium candelabrum]